MTFLLRPISVKVGFLSSWIPLAPLEVVLYFPPLKDGVVACSLGVAVRWRLWLYAVVGWAGGANLT